MKDREEFIKKWKIQRRKGKPRYVLTHAGLIGGYGLAGSIIGSIFLYNSTSAYSFGHYLPTYIIVFLGVLLIAALKYMYEWGKNEEKFSKLLDE